MTTNNFTRIFDIPDYQHQKYSNKRALGLFENGRWSYLSCAELIEKSRIVAWHYLQKNLKKGDRVVIFLNEGNPFWSVIDYGLMQIGVITVPVNNQTHTEELQYILREIQPSMLIHFGQDLQNNIKLAIKQSMCKAEIDQYEYFPSIAPSFLTQPLDGDAIIQLDAIKAQISASDIATIVYTSGTTGSPKGVMLSHDNLVSNIKATLALMPINYQHKFYSFLPVTHIFERMVNYTCFAAGASIHFSDQQRDFKTQIQDIRPDFFTTVPRIIERFYSYLIKDAKSRSRVFRRFLLWTIHRARKERVTAQNKLSFILTNWLVDLIVYSRWRSALGGRIKGIMVGASALDPKLARMFNIAGLKIREGYGLTETSPVISFNQFTPGGMRYGTVGIPIPSLQIRILDPNQNGIGQIQVKGAGVMQGYYKQPEITAEILDADGWLSTGDTGRIVFQKFLQITGRTKELFKTSSGKYIVPEKIETLFNRSEYIDHSLVFGRSKPHPGLMILPNEPALKKWCEANGVHWTSLLYMVINRKVEAFYQGLIDKVNENLESHEKLRTFSLIADDWNLENKALSYTGKLRRFHLEQQYESNISEAYEKK